MQDGLRLPDRTEPGQYWTSTGTWAFYQSADRIYSSRQQPFLVTETNASHIGFPWDSRPAYDGQWRQVAWALVSRGARMVEYWHWHTNHFGAETYWGGVLPHSGQPGRTYRELARLGGELAAAGAKVAGLVPDADVAIVWSNPSKWLLEKYAALMGPDGGPDARSYQGLVGPFYRGAFDAGLQVRLLHAGQLTGGGRPGVGLAPADAARLHPVLVATGLYVVEDDMLDWLLAYAAAGGHLVLGPRTGYGDHEGRARAESAPARLREAAGVAYDEFCNLLDRRPGHLDHLRPARRCRCRPLARRPRGQGRRGACRLRPPALRPVVGRHHQDPRPRPDHHRRSPSGPGPGPGPDGLAGARAGQRLARPAGERHRHDGHRPGRRADPRGAQLVLRPGHRPHPRPARGRAGRRRGGRLAPAARPLGRPRPGRAGPHTSPARDRHSQRNDHGTSDEPRTS